MINFPSSEVAGKQNQVQFPESYWKCDFPLPMSGPRWSVNIIYCQGFHLAWPGIVYGSRNENTTHVIKMEVNSHLLLLSPCVWQSHSVQIPVFIFLLLGLLAMLRMMLFMCVYLYEQGQILGEFCCVLPRVIYVHCQRLGCDLALERFCLLWFCLQNIKFNKLSMESCLNTKADWSVPPSLPLQGACKPLVRCQRIPLGKIHYSCIVKCFHLCSCSHN